jgi:hypothetical protein
VFLSYEVFGGKVTEEDRAFRIGHVALLLFRSGFPHAFVDH